MNRQVGGVDLDDLTNRDQTVLPAEKDEFVTKSIGLKLKRINAGSFTMGTKKRR